MKFLAAINQMLYKPERILDLKYGLKKETI